MSGYDSSGLPTPEVEPAEEPFSWAPYLAEWRALWLDRARAMGRQPLLLRCPEPCTCGTNCGHWCGRAIGPCGRCLQHCICSDDNEGLRALGRKLGL